MRPPLGYYDDDFGLKTEGCFDVWGRVVLSRDFIVSSLVSELVFGRGLAMGFICVGSLICFVILFF
jgi:hypothetical protein